VVPKNKEDAPALAKAQREHLVRSVTRRMVPDKGGTVVKDYDKNKDGLIQEEEIPQRHRRMILRRYDKDRNKVLNQQEQAELQKGLNALRGVLKR
jgi:hypothetical protein